MTNPVISIVSADSVTVFVGGKPFTVASDQSAFEPLKEAIAAGDYDRVDQLVNVSDTLAAALGQFGDVAVYRGHVTFQGRHVHNYLVDKLLQMVQRGRDPEPYALFLDRVMRNPTQSAANQLFGWLERAKLPVLPDGRFLAYRRVKKNYTDVNTGKMDNTPGIVVSLPRDQCDLNKDNTCSAGLHFCNHQYLSRFSGERFLIMAEDPGDVVSFPDDEGGSKGRTSRHEVLFEIDAQTALDNKFFATEDELVFSWDRVEHYQREQLKFIDNSEELYAAYDAGWRVVHNGRQQRGPSWELVRPNGLVIDTFADRGEAWPRRPTWPLPRRPTRPSARSASSSSATWSILTRRTI